MTPPATPATPSMGYDVFMSFRGADTRMGFTSHLYDALTRNDIITYKDDKTLEIGKPIASELLEAIETSKIAVVVLSSHFATSKWCLDEIAKIVDCMKQGKLIILPVFYHVAPSDVRHQRKSFEQAFSNHEVDPQLAEKVKIWRASFKEVGALSGLHVTEHSDEAEVVSKIVSRILRDLPDTMPIDLSNSLVGIKSRVDEVKGILRMESTEVLFIGICGMSGIGKTTLAEAVYKDIKRKFDKSSLIENIKDISKQNDSTDLCKLQQKLLDGILNEKRIRVQSVIHGQTLLGTKLRGFKVIIVLDDVNHVDQLTYLAGGLEWFGPGSRIIVTTTNRDLLNYYKMSEVYFCEEMKGDEARSLFCQSAFKQSHPAHGYEKLSDDIVKLAGGLPLALNVYGSILCGKDENYWKGMLEKLREYPEKQILGRLEVVYARLDRDQRYTFIYIACFLKGRHKDLVNDILSSIGLHPECGITDLINKCLITINLEDNVWMHDLLQQMCWEIICRESDSKHNIAIKSHKDVVDVLSCNQKGTQSLEVINQEPCKGELNDCFKVDPTCFRKMTKLKFLRISNIDFPEGLMYLSNDLRILEWSGCSLKSLPSMFEPKHIFELLMCSSQLQTLWKKDVELPNLRSINLSFSKNLTELPDLTSASNLVKLNLEGCTNLTSLHPSVLIQKRLRYLNLKGCTCLESLGTTAMEMEALEALLLSGCSKLEYIPEFGKNMKRLEHLYVDGTRIKKLPENLGEMRDLRYLDASQTSIEEVPPSIWCLRKLRLLHANRCWLSFKTGCFLNLSLDTFSSGLKEVDLSYCNLSVVPDDIGLLSHLITLDLSGNEFVLLPASIGLLSKLRMLCLNNCKRLQSLPKLSLVDEDMDYGPRNRFSYYISEEGVDVSKFRASNYNNRPTVLCLNCPVLAVDKRGSDLAEKILNNYLELRSRKYWLIPEAVFEIISAGSEIPPGFVDPGVGGLILEGQWIAVAICAVISVDHACGYNESNHMVTARIRLGTKYWKIPVPINFLAWPKTQIILYWTIVDDCERIACPSHWGIFNVSFDVEPDSNFHVAKVGVRFIREEYIMCLKQHEDSNIWLGNGIYKTFNHKSYMDMCEGDTNLHQHTFKMVNFICDYGCQQDSLDGIYQITKGLHEINQEFVSVFGVNEREWWYEEYLYCYYVISLGISVLYKDFVQSLKDVNDGWLSVKLALEQILIKSRADYYSYEEMVQHINDLEAAHSVEFSNNFITMFLSICRRVFDFFHSYKLPIEVSQKKPPKNLLLRILPKNILSRMPLENKSSRNPMDYISQAMLSRKEIAKISRIPITGVMCMMAVYMGDFEHLKEVKDSMSRILWRRIFVTFTKARDYFTEDGWFVMEKIPNRELHISDFSYNGILLQQLMNKMGPSKCFTKENKDEMMCVIDKLQNNIDKVSSIIQKMSAHADQYSHDIGEAQKYVKSFSRLSVVDNIISMLPLFNKS